MDELRPPTEIQIQADIWTTLWKDHHEARRCLFHVPNESTYNNGQQASSGVIAGIQDLIFVWAGRTWYIELKDDSGSISPAQKLIHSLWKVQGYDTYVFRVVEEAVAFLKAVIAGDVDPDVWGVYISPYSVAEKYDELLADYKKRQREARYKRSQRSYASSKTKKY